MEGDKTKLAIVIGTTHVEMESFAHWGVVRGQCQVGEDMS